MPIHKGNLTDQDFMRSLRFITKYGEEADIDPAYYWDLLSTHILARGLERVADALNNVARAIATKEAPIPEQITRKKFSERI